MTRADLETLGDQFYEAAKAYWDAELGRSSLTNLIGLYLMFVK